MKKFHKALTQSVSHAYSIPIIMEAADASSPKAHSDRHIADSSFCYCLRHTAPCGADKKNHRAIYGSDPISPVFYARSVLWYVSSFTVLREY